MVQETKPQFLDQFRRLVDNYNTARELLPSETEVSNVLDALQQMARANSVRVTMFDASKPGAKSIPTATPNAAAPGTPAKSPQTAQPEITLNERVMPAQIQGTHANVARFLSDVAKYPRIIYVRDLSITALHKQESVNLTLVTYDAPTSGILPPIPTELRDEFQSHTARLPN
jgi:Tfp pilus assembly protein PilO